MLKIVGPICACKCCSDVNFEVGQSKYIPNTLRQCNMIGSVKTILVYRDFKRTMTLMFIFTEPVF